IFLEPVLTAGNTDDNKLIWYVRGSAVSISDSGYLIAHKSTVRPAEIYAKMGNVESRHIKVSVSEGDDVLCMRESSVRLYRSDDETKYNIRLSSVSPEMKVKWSVDSDDDHEISVEKSGNTGAKVVIPAGYTGHFNVLASSEGVLPAECEFSVGLVEPAE
ncbi:MAG: hypothetical protein K6E33_02405, partial [Lachnospiraceae bacterium]|nr:hypothetical protein [Lachnospiraceae bacterium]